MKKLNEETFETEVLQAKGMILLKFTAKWCPPCQKIQPILEKASEEVEHPFFEVDTDESPAIAKKYGVKTIPTLIVFKDGQVYNTCVGTTTKENVLKLFE